MTADETAIGGKMEMAKDYVEYRASRDDGEPPEEAAEEVIKEKDMGMDDEDWAMQEAWLVPTRSSLGIASNPLTPMRRLDGWPQFLKHDIHLELAPGAIENAIPTSLDQGGPPGSLDDGGEAPIADQSATLMPGGMFYLKGRPPLPPKRYDSFSIGAATRLTAGGRIDVGFGQPPCLASTHLQQACAADRGRSGQLPGRGWN